MYVCLLHTFSLVILFLHVQDISEFSKSLKLLCLSARDLNYLVDENENIKLFYTQLKSYLSSQFYKKSSIRIFYFLKKSLEMSLSELKILFNKLSQRVLNILFFC